MKKIKYIALVFIAIGMFTITSCVDRDIDPPSFSQSVADTSDGTVITITEFKNLAPELSKGQVKALDTNLYVRGVVVANGASGNIYKKMYIQDCGLEDPFMVRGLEISIDKTSLYTFYPVGQVVYLRCNGFYIGMYDEYKQFGYIDANGGPGRIPTQLVDSAILIHGLPHADNIPEPKTFSSVAGVSTSNISRLVRFTNVSFETPGDIYAHENEQYPERIIVDSEGNKMVVSTSSYANFAADTIPTGNGDITGILTVYGGSANDVQSNSLIIRGLDDVRIYTEIYNSEFTSSPSDWTIKDIAGDASWSYNSSSKSMEIDGYTDSSGEGNEDWFISPSIDLTDAINPIFTFTSKRRFEDPSEQNPMTVMITDNYIEGDYSNWTELSASFSTNTTFSVPEPTSSGDINLTDYTGGSVRVAFVYKSSSDGEGTASRWDIDNVTVNDK